MGIKNYIKLLTKEIVTLNTNQKMCSFKNNLNVLLLRTQLNKSLKHKYCEGYDRIPVCALNLKKTRNYRQVSKRFSSFERQQLRTCTYPSSYI